MELTVESVRARATDEGLAVLGREAMDELGLESGDYVTVGGHDGDGVVAKAWLGPPEDAERAVVRLDGELRQAIGVGIDDRVAVERADVRSAERVTVALPEAGRQEPRGLYFRDDLLDRAVTGGQVLSVTPEFGSPSERAGRRFPIRVVGTDPSGTVVVREWTDIVVSETPAAGLATDAETPRAPEITETGEGGSAAVTYDDVGGVAEELERIREAVELPARHPELFDALGSTPPTGVLLYGPPGTGKTLVSKALANETGVCFRTIAGSDVVSKHYGETEERLRGVFEEAAENEPAIVLLDDLDSIASEREGAGGDAERRVVGQLLSLLDGLEERSRVVVIGTTDRPDALDPALRRPGRFDREIELGVPDEASRKEILEVHTRGMPLAADVDLDRYAGETHGFVGADLANLLTESTMGALRRVRPALDFESGEIDPEVLDSLRVTDADVREALAEVEPSALREVFVEVPDVAWGDVGGLEEAKGRLQETVQWPLRYPDAFDRVALHPAKGVLLHGPPGTGKTLLAKALANEAESNFISIKGPELLNEYVGGSERGVREVFAKARENAPTIVFFDEIDAIAGERGRNASDSGVGERVVSQLLTELDGLEGLEDVVVIAASNRPDLIDDALVRPGRLDRHVHVSTPERAARREIFAVHVEGRPLAEGIALDDLAARTEGYVGADIEAVCREAATVAVREFVHSTERGESGCPEEIYLHPRHFDRALEEVGDRREEAGRFEESTVGAR
jgi:transitional endoplasmic reticulum ATPase